MTSIAQLFNFEKDTRKKREKDRDKLIRAMKVMNILSSAGEGVSDIIAKGGGVVENAVDAAEEMGIPGVSIAGAIVQNLRNRS